MLAFGMELLIFIWNSCLIVWLGDCSKPRVVGLHPNQNFLESRGAKLLIAQDRYETLILRRDPWKLC